MKGEDEVDSTVPVVVTELPGQLSVEGFFGKYSQYLQEQENLEQGAKPVAEVIVIFLLNALAILLVAIGGLTIIFGPRTISYSLLTGPTFLQFIQMYPGPIASVGALLAGVARLCSGMGGNAVLTPEQFLLASYELKLSEALDQSAQISVEHVSWDLFRVSRS